MNVIKQAQKLLLLMIGVKPAKIVANALGASVDYLTDQIVSMYKDAQEDRDILKEKLRTMSDEELRQTYIPDVFQKNIYKIDYDKLKDRGIKLISYDIDDTIGDVLVHNIKAGIPGLKVTMYKEGKDAKELIEKLHSMGFTVVLLTNAQQAIAEGVWKEIGADDYFDNAGKPDPRTFNEIMKKYNIEKSQMAHVGNNIRQDVAGGNAAGVTTCLVRNYGVAMKVGKTMLRMIGIRSKGHLVREELKKRGPWRKHHKYVSGDQYYQLGETAEYIQTMQGNAYAKGMQEHERQILKDLKDSIK